MILDASFNNTEVHAPLQEVQIALESNPSTGATWNVYQDGGPNCFLTDRGWSGDPTPPGTMPMPGSGGTSHWSVAPRNRGRCDVVLVYRQAWTNPGPMDRYWRVTLIFDR